MEPQCTRRRFLQKAGVGTALPWLARTSRADETPRRPRVAVIYTVLRFRSHAFNFLENFLRPLLFNGKLIEPPIDVVSFYADQRVEEGDMTDDVVRQFKLPARHDDRGCPDPGRQGPGRRCRAAHRRARRVPGQRPGPDASIRASSSSTRSSRVMRRSNRFVPIFNDKHLSYRWDWAKEMYDTAQKHAHPADGRQLGAAGPAPAGAGAARPAP